MKKHTMKLLVLLTLTAVLTKCSSSSDSGLPVPITPTTSDVEVWITKGDQSVQLAKQPGVLNFGTVANAYPTLTVDETQTYQTVDGFGYTLTGGSAQVINQLNAAKKQELLQELFGTSATSIGISYLRLSIGASDLNDAPFTYDDMPIGQQDLTLANFSLAPDMTDLIPLLHEILLINPNIKFMAVPWSAPTWMKTNINFVGGSLQTPYYSVYAQYFVKYIQAMQQQGITIDAVCPQNEPLNPNNNPSMLMTAVQQKNFVKTNLGPAFQAANLTTKIVVYDHNCDVTQYALDILNDPTANGFVNGTAFHLYGGDISALTTVHDAFPAKNVYFTEQWTSSTGSFAGDLKWHVKNVVIGSMRNWSKNALEWNLANNSVFGPHTTGGCSQCKGAITIENSTLYTRNVAYYNIAHASKFVPTGSVRIGSTKTGTLNTVAFKTPQGKKVMVVENDGSVMEAFSIKYNGQWVAVTLDAGAVATYIW